MSQFEPSVSFTMAEPSRALVYTPLGTMAFEAFAGGVSLPVERTLVGEGGIELRRYEHPHADVELLLLPFPPSLPEGMRVDECVAAVWRVSVQGDLPPLTLRAEYTPGSANQDGGYNCGEHLTALTWEGQGTVVSLGTSDEEALSYAAEDGLLPARLAPCFLENDCACTRAVRERDGLEVELPPLLAGESAQVHAVVAWKEGVGDEREASPWFAVDVAPREVARMVDQALNGTFAD